MIADDESFYGGLVDAANACLEEATRRIAALRRENAELRKIIAEFPSTATDLQDRVTMLEGLKTPGRLE